MRILQRLALNCWPEKVAQLFLLKDIKASHDRKVIKHRTFDNLLRQSLNPIVE